MDKTFYFFLERCTRSESQSDRVEPIYSSCDFHHKQDYLHNKHYQLYRYTYVHSCDISSSQVHLLFRPFKDMSHQRTGSVYFPPRGGVDTYQPELVAEERGDSTR